MIVISQPEWLVNTFMKSFQKHECFKLACMFFLEHICVWHIFFNIVPSPHRSLTILVRLTTVLYYVRNVQTVFEQGLSRWMQFAKWTQGKTCLSFFSSHLAFDFDQCFLFVIGHIVSRFYFATCFWLLFVVCPFDLGNTRLSLCH